MAPPETPDDPGTDPDVANALRVLLSRTHDVEAALARRDAGDYGRCENCGRPIAPGRLAARPAARTCIDCAA